MFHLQVKVFKPTPDYSQGQKMRNEKRNMRKGLAVAVIAVFLGISFMPVVNTSISNGGGGTTFHTSKSSNSVQESVDVEMTQYAPDGSVKEKVISLPLKEVNELKERLIAAKTADARFFILKEYGLISREQSLAGWRGEMLGKAGSMGLTDAVVQGALSSYAEAGIFNLPILLNFFCKVNAVYVLSAEAHLGFPPVIGLNKLFGSSKMLKFDIADMCLGAFGMVETKGLLRTHTLAAVASFMALAGFVGVHIHIPLVLDVYNGFSAMTFAVGLGIRNIEFNLGAISIMSTLLGLVIGGLIMQGLSGGGSGTS